jgi:rhamnose transport system permease protein
MSAGSAIQLAVRDRVLARVGQWHYILAALTILVALVALITIPSFSSSNNLSQMVAAVSEKAIVILPMALIIIVREIDLSVASIMGMSSVTAGLIMQAGMPVPVAVAAALLVGLAGGAFNGFFVAVLGLPSIVVTLGTLALYRGICYIALGSQSISVFPEVVTDFGFGYVPGTRIPLTILPFIVLVAVYAVVLHRSATGRRIFAVGGGPEVALYAGVRVRLLKFWLFATSGLVCGLAGVIYTARLSSARADNAFGLELDIITIVFLGGVSMLGGRGNIAGISWALALVAIVRDVMALKGLAGDAQGTAVGLLLILSLLFSNTAGAAIERWRKRARTDAFVAAGVEEPTGREEVPVPEKT